MACDIHCIFNWFVIILSVFGLILYVISLIVLLKHRNGDLNTSFFKIITSLGFVDVLYTLNQLFISRGITIAWNYFPFTRQWIASKWFPTFKGMADWSFYYVQLAGIILVALNRMTAMIWLGSSESIWSKNVVSLAITIQWLCLFPFSLPMLHSCCHMEIESNQTFLVQFQNPEVGYAFWTVDVFLEMCIILPSLVAMHVVLFIKVLGHKATVAPVMYRNVQVQTTDQNQFSMEVRFVIVGSVLCSCYGVLAVNYGIVWLRGGYYLGTIHQMIVIFVYNILFTFMNPVLLLIFSTKFRNKFIEFVSHS